MKSKKVVHLAKELKKEQKAKAKQEKTQQKKYIAFLKACGVKPSDSVEEVNNKVLYHIATMRYGFQSVPLTPAQLGDPKFLTSLYKVQDQMAYYFPVDPTNAELQSNNELMYTFITKLLFANSFNTDDGLSTNDAIELLAPYYTAMTSPELVEKLIRDGAHFPYLSIANGVVDLNTMLATDAIEEKGKQDFDSLIRNLSYEALRKEVVLHREEALSCIPEDHPYYSDLKALSTAILSPAQIKEFTSISAKKSNEPEM